MHKVRAASAPACADIPLLPAKLTLTILLICGCVTYIAGVYLISKDSNEIAQQRINWYFGIGLGLIVLEPGGYFFVGSLSTSFSATFLPLVF